MYKAAYKLLEKNLLPDVIVRYFIRRLCEQRLRDEQNRFAGEEGKLKWINQLKNSPIAIETDKANEQHYEVPARFYELCLGKNLKYSSSFFPSEGDTLEKAEAAMLELYCKRAGIESGQEILDLGCGWGSLSLYLAEKYPASRITGVSNSASQRDFIIGQACERGLTNLEIITCNINDLVLHKKFDRVVSIEMLEHVRNYQLLFENISGWLKPEGQMFIHIFCHKDISYPFDVQDDSDWMSKYFFTGGQMPALDLFENFQDHLTIQKKWQVPGIHYQLTSERWLENMDRNKKEILSLFQDVYGKREALKWFVYWRVFFMACAELFGYNQGGEWMVGHYLLKKKS